MENRFEALCVEDATNADQPIEADFQHDKVSAGCEKGVVSPQTPEQTITATASLDIVEIKTCDKELAALLGDDHLFQLGCLFVDFRTCLSRVERAWKAAKNGKIPFTSAAVVSSVALAIVSDLIKECV